MVPAKDIIADNDPKSVGPLTFAKKKLRAESDALNPFVGVASHTNHKW